MPRQNPFPPFWNTSPIAAEWQRAPGTISDILISPRVATHVYGLDIAGTGDSEGIIHDEYLASELQDGVEIIAWLAQQSWCDGNDVLTGKSWGGFNALQVAALRPPALKAVITACSTDDRYADDMHYMGGAPLTGTLDWGRVTLAAWAGRRTLSWSANAGERCGWNGSKS